MEFSTCHGHYNGFEIWFEIYTLKAMMPIITPATVAEVGDNRKHSKPFMKDADLPFW